MVGVVGCTYTYESPPLYCRPVNVIESTPAVVVPNANWPLTGVGVLGVDCGGADAVLVVYENVNGEVSVPAGSAESA